MKTSGKALTIAMLLVIAFALLPSGIASNTPYYNLADTTGGTVSYRLHVSIPETLIEYYNGLSHRLSSVSDFSKFVTPYALAPIADKLWQIYDNQEDYANAVLRIVHQITYTATVEGKYPVETMTDGEGDCDLFSYIAASILLAGNFSVVLLYYESQEHMNVGIHLSSPPEDVRHEISTVTYVTYDDVKYYMGECTGGLYDSDGDYFGGWRVGESDSSLKGASVQVISLESTMQTIAPGQVSASLNIMKSSTLSLGSIFSLVIQDGDFSLSGQINPAIQDQNVTLYTRDFNSEWIELGSTTTQLDGKFTYTWNPESAGFYSLLASWSGDDTYAGATSSTIYVLVVPWYLLGAAVLLFVGGISMLVVWAVKRSKKHPVIISPPPPNNESSTL